MNNDLDRASYRTGDLFSGDDYEPTYGKHKTPQPHRKKGGSGRRDTMSPGTSMKRGARSTPRRSSLKNANYNPNVSGGQDEHVDNIALDS